MNVLEFDLTNFTRWVASNPSSFSANVMTSPDLISSGGTDLTKISDPTGRFGSMLPVSTFSKLNPTAFNIRKAAPSIRKTVSTNAKIKVDAIFFFVTGSSDEACTGAGASETAVSSVFVTEASGRLASAFTSVGALSATTDRLSFSKDICFLKNSHSFYINSLKFQI